MQICSKVAVGWDPGLSTYFAVVFGAPEGDSELVIASWQGRTPGQLPSVCVLEEAIYNCATLPGEVLANLKADKQVSSILTQPQFGPVVSLILGFP